MGQSGDGRDHFGVWRLERELFGQKGDTVASGFGIEGVWCLVDLQFLGFADDLEILFRHVAIHKWFIGRTVAGAARETYCPVSIHEYLVMKASNLSGPIFWRKS